MVSRHQGLATGKFAERGETPGKLLDRADVAGQNQHIGRVRSQKIDEQPNRLVACPAHTLMEVGSESEAQLDSHDGGTASRYYAPPEQAAALEQRVDKRSIASR